MFRFSYCPTCSRTAVENGRYKNTFLSIHNGVMHHKVFYTSNLNQRYVARCCQVSIRPTLFAPTWGDQATYLGRSWFSTTPPNTEVGCNLLMSKSRYELPQIVLSKFCDAQVGTNCDSIFTNWEYCSCHDIELGPANRIFLLLSYKSFNRTLSLNLSPFFAHSDVRFAWISAKMSCVIFDKTKCQFETK